MSTSTVEVVLGSGLDSVPRSRAFVTGALPPDAEHLAGDAALIATELVTNAILHGRPPVRVRVQPLAGGVRIEVEDAGSKIPFRVRRSTDAMTGRGLDLVGALSAAWGVEPAPDGGKTIWAELRSDAARDDGSEPALADDVDLEALLAAFPDDDRLEERFTVELGSVPTDLLLDAKSHMDNLVREFTLEAAAADESAAAFGVAVPIHLAELVRTVVHGFSAARNAIKRQAVAAAERGEPEVRLTLTLPASAAHAGEEYLAALDEADRWARHARLLTLETPPVHKVFRHWYVQSLVDQLRAKAAGRTPPPIVTFPQRLAAAFAAAPHATPDSAPPARVAGEPGVDYVALFRSLPTPYMVMDRDLMFVEANDAYLANVARTREELLGRPVFEAFPPTPDALDASGVSRVQRSFERVRDTGEIDRMPVQKYDIPDPVHGGLVERYWSLISAPIRDTTGEVILIAQRAEDITDFVAERAHDENGRTAELGRRIEEVEADLFSRAQELDVAIAAKEQAAHRVATLAGVALALTGAETVDDLTRIVFEHGLPVLGAAAGAIGVRDDQAGVLRLTTSGTVAAGRAAGSSELPLDSPLPTAAVARTGTRVLLPNRAAGLRWSPALKELYEATGHDAWAALPLRTGDQRLGALVVSWTEEREFDADDIALLEGFAAQVSQALRRIRATEAERAAARAAQRLSETLQRSLLTEPPPIEGLQIAVRYQPAAQGAQIGGDWYDAFITAAGSTLLVIGDISGHDRTAAALMGQVRNLLRGIAYDSDEGPGVLLARLDRAIGGLALDTVATALLARVELGDDVEGGGARLRWSSAGHLPPVLRTPDGVLTVLEDESDLLLGLDADSPRTERTTRLAPGSTLVLFTDGLVERRDTSLDAGVRRVVDAVSALGDADPEVTADAVVSAAGGTNEDDIAVLVLRVR